MAEESNRELKRGCLIFLIAVVVLGAAAGLSVLITGKNTKPKARLQLIAKPKARLKEIKSKLSPDMAPDIRANFIKTFEQYSDALEKNGAAGFETLSEASESLKDIEADGTITADEAIQWTETVKKALGFRP